MKTRHSSPPFCFSHLPLLLTLLLLAGCSSDSRDRLWQTIDPAGYKHAHSESFNGIRALPTRRAELDPAKDEMTLELNQ